MMASVDEENSSPFKAKAKRTSRANTTEEKRRMRKCRKKKKRSAKCQTIRALQQELDEERQLGAKRDKQVMLYKRMSRSFWERWQWELRQRKEAMKLERAMTSQRRGHTSRVVTSSVVQEIEHTLLQDPVEKGELYIGRGSFGLVKLQMFRGMMVAVKELLPHTLLLDVQNEAVFWQNFAIPSFRTFLAYVQL